MVRLFMSDFTQQSKTVKKSISQRAGVKINSVSDTCKYIKVKKYSGREKKNYQYKNYAYLVLKWWYVKDLWKTTKTI